jgi:hypothetical protein
VEGALLLVLLGGVLYNQSAIVLTPKPVEQSVHMPYLYQIALLAYAQAIRGNTPKKSKIREHCSF